MISSQLIKVYMDQHFHTREQSTYARYQAQVVDFVNCYLNEKVHAVKAIGFKRTVKRLQFPAASVAPVHQFLLDYYHEQRSLPSTPERIRKIAKCLGKFSPIAASVPLPHYSVQPSPSSCTSAAGPRRPPGSSPTRASPATSTTS